MRLLVHGLAGYTKGGIETFVFGMAEHMSDEVVFDYVIEKKNNADVTKMPGKGDTLVIEPKRHKLANLKSWVKLLRERKNIDSAVYFNWYSMAWLFPAIIARFLGYRVIIHAHNNNLHNCGLLQRTLHAVNRQVQKFMKITRLTNSELSARFFFGNKPAKMIYNAIDTERFAFSEEVRNRVRKEYKIENNRVYGFAGRIAYQKNPLFLMEIFSEIKKIDTEAAFLVCGDGDLMEQAKKKAANLGLEVIFVGSISNVQDYYQAMDVFILPSLFEGLGIVLIEAQCCGLPCVASADVIPQDAKVTDLVEFVKLSDNSLEWAKKIVAHASIHEDRKRYSQVVRNTRFYIKMESCVLKNILRDSSSLIL